MERVAVDPLEVPGPGRRLVSRVVVTDRIPIVSSESNCLNCSLTAPWGFAMFTRPPASYSGPGPPPILDSISMLEWNLTSKTNAAVMCSCAEKYHFVHEYRIVFCPIRKECSSFFSFLVDIFIS